MQTHDDPQGIAILGMAGRFPDAADLAALWRMLADGRSAFRALSDAELRAGGVAPDLIAHPDYVKADLLVPGIEDFDAGFFGIQPRDAALTDPQHRLFMECAYQALEQAGYPPGTTAARTGVYAGVGKNVYREHQLGPRLAELVAAVGQYRLDIMNEKDFVATALAYNLGLTGPALTVQTACSTSLVAVHLACQGLLSYDCDLALAGGVSLDLPQGRGYRYEQGGILSPDGHCRPFAAAANGTVFGGGGGVVLLKRLADALADRDSILAVIRGSAINNDGRDKIGFTAPSVGGQTRVVLEALAAAGVAADDLSYIEAHGTGTPLGDPIEIRALTQAFRGSTRRTGFCAIGSVKSNIGHGDAAAGIAGLIKTVLALTHETIPATLYAQPSNPQIDFAGSPFFVNSESRPWPATPERPRLAGVSAFGIGGTNAHVIVAEAPVPPPRVSVVREAEILVLSAKTPSALERTCANLAAHLQSHPEQPLADVAYTLSRGRTGLRQRRMLVGRDAAHAVEQLRAATRLPSAVAGEGPPSLALLLPGQGTQYPGMAAGLYRCEPVFRDCVDRCAELVASDLGLDLRRVLFDQAGAYDLTQTALTQPALFVVDYALATLWQHWGLAPTALLGHSLGEYVAACLAGVWSLEDALTLVAARGRLIQSLPPGAMLAVALSEPDARTWCSDAISLAVVNGPKRCVLAGTPASIEKLVIDLDEYGIAGRRLATSHAYHSRLLEPMLDAFGAQLDRVAFAPPRRPWLSNLTGDWIRPDEATDPGYWVRHLREPVRFADNLARLFAQGIDRLLECGPGTVLSTLAQEHPDRPSTAVCVTSLPRDRDTSARAERSSMLQGLGRLWLAGAEIDWEALYRGESRGRVPLPTYPFERTRCWIEPLPTSNASREQPPVLARETPTQADADPLDARPGSAAPRPAAAVPSAAPGGDDTERTIVRIWQDCIGIQAIGPESTFRGLGGDSLTAVQVVARMNQAFAARLTINDLLINPSIAELARALRREADATAAPAAPAGGAAVRLKPGQAHRQPLFLIHPAGGNLFIYRDLVERIDARHPIWGLAATGLQDDARVTLSVEDMADEYLDALRRIQPGGPYRLVGASSGGLVAYEIARRLEALGEAVALVALLDTPIGRDLPAQFLTRPFILEYFADIFSGGEALRRELPSHLDHDAQVDALYRALKTHGHLVDGMDLAEWRRLVAVFAANLDAVRAYEPGPYAGHLVYFRAQSRRPRYDPPHPELPWLELAEHGTTVHVVPGDHLSMFRPPYVQALNARLTPYLHPIED